MAGYIGVGGKAQKATDLYVGVGGEARWVIKAYVGDEDGNAKLWYELEKKKISFKIKVLKGPPEEEEEPEVTAYLSSEAYIGMTLAEWVLSDLSKHDSYYAASFMSDDEVCIIKITSRTTGKRRYITWPSKFRFMNRHDGATLDPHNQEVIYP